MTPAQNSVPQNPENQLASTLQRQADRFAQHGGGSLELEQVVSRAGEIRRGRRMRATMVMAAVVLAVAVPIGVTSLGSNATKSPAVPMASTTPDDSVLGLNDLKTGAPPKNGYLFSGVLYGDKEPQSIGPGGDPIEIARINGGFLVARSDAKTNGSVVTFVGDDGSSPGVSWPYDGGFAVSPQRNVGAFVEPDGTVMAVQDGGAIYTEVGKLPAGESYSVSAVVGENCSGRSEEVGCTVYAHSNGENPRVFKISPHGKAQPAFDGMRTLFDIAPDGRAIGVVSVSDEGGCSEVRTADNAVLWKTCKYVLLAFSPDGKYLLAGSAYQDGFGSGNLTILDAATGNVALDLDAVHEATLTDPRWEDDGHVLVPVFQSGKWAIVRVALDGSREYATRQAPDKDMYGLPFKLG